MPLSDIDCGAEDNSKRLDIAMLILEQARRRPKIGDTKKSYMMNDQQAEAPMPPQRGRPRKQPLESRPAVPKPPRVPGTAEWSKGGRPTRERQKERDESGYVRRNWPVTPRVETRSDSSRSVRPEHPPTPPAAPTPPALPRRGPGRPRTRPPTPPGLPRRGPGRPRTRPPTPPPPPRRRGPGTPRKMLATPLGGKPGRPLAPALDLGPDHPIDRRSDNYPAPGAGYATSSSSEGGRSDTGSLAASRQTGRPGGSHSVIEISSDSSSDTMENDKLYND
ncbi:hypothetical protein PGQ11_007040 [Apiospora arundinis]|uniref:Uncharacterized protein n=1 Tax=Apiospora arundinis TaxID=335852 RepID=A0ABR2IUI7_9PEZI